MALAWTSWTSWLVGGVFSLIAFSLWQMRQKHWRYRQQVKLPGPSLSGCIIPFFTEGIFVAFEKFQKQYGKMYFVAGPTSQGIVVSDLDLVKEVMIKQFTHFPNRASQPSRLGKPWDDILTVLKDDHWKHVRSQLSPTFSTGKIKKMMPAIQRVCTSLQKALEEKAKSGEPVELKLLCGTFSMDVIAGAAFGIHVDSIHNPTEPFVKHALAFENPRILSFLIFIFLPKLFWVLRKIGLGIIPKASEDFFLDVTDAALNERRQDEKKHSDFLQLLLEAEREGEQQKPVDHEIDHGDQLATSTQWTRKGLTHDEMRANAMLFILAGYGTVSTVLSFTLFCLAANPECLQKAQAEVDQKRGKRLVDYDTANELTYLDMCINESMRLYPPGFIVNREANEDTELGGVHLSKGNAVTIPVRCIHLDPELFPDPMKFDPERHTPEAKATRHPCAFMPFGMGPRNCIGMRLAQMEVRMALASVLQKFSPVLCDKSVYPPKLSKLRMVANDGMWVRFEDREQ